ncbi:MAG: DnaA regulatory inactivator Hda [Kangiellaceae bacterium]|nr:DnaA regulatory inactivator Hda [Kangiellaceae bacterium]MCW8998128.1 DnaA regulatory inactivator Hda [Kangiellaceae bacterium]
MLQIPLQIQLNDDATFDNYYIGSNSQLVAKLQQLSLQQPDFVYVWGPSQSGKSHLAQALCAAYGDSGYGAAYLPLGESQLVPEILNGMQSMPLVCIDQIEKVESDADWANALFDLYNNMKLENHSLIIFGENAPSHSKWQLADLKSRLCAMEIYKIESLSDEDKHEIIRNRANNRGIELSTEVIKYIMSRRSRSINDLMQVLDKIDHSSMALKRKVTIPLVKELFEG